jgi:3-deoxy-D-manno-octulosonate 8-phosphate phosphatase KdsC-like HAD superfamily phosphatase
LSTKGEGRNIRRNDLDPSDVLSSFSIGGSVDAVVVVVDTVVADIGDIAVVEIIGVIEFVSSLHMSLPEIDEGVDEEKGGDGGENEFGDYICQRCREAE